MIVVTRVPDVPPTPDTPTQTRRPPAATFTPTLIGADGSVWNLLDNASVMLMPGAQFAGVQVAHQLRTSPVLDGARWSSVRTDASDVLLPVAVMADDWQTWRKTDRSLWRALNPSGECSFQIAAPDAETFTLGLRFVAGGDVTMNPLADNFAAYTLEFIAPNPYWRGEPVRRVYSQAPPVPLFPGPPFGISRGGSTGAAELITNPGDVPATPRYTVNGPAARWTIGVGDALVTSDRPLTAGQSVTVDMDPNQLTILDHTGANMHRHMSAVNFAAIPPGVDVPLNLSVVGTNAASSVVVEFTPLYRRPW